MKKAEIIAALNRMDAVFFTESTWTKGRYGFHEGPCCIYGAACRAAGTKGDEPVSLLKALKETLGPDGRVLEEWNDSPQRTFEDIKKLISDTRTRLEASQ